MVERKRMFSAIFPKYIPTVQIVYRLALIKVRDHVKNRGMNVISGPEPMSESSCTESFQTQEREYVPAASTLCARYIRVNFLNNVTAKTNSIHFLNAGHGCILIDPQLTEHRQVARPDDSA